MDELLNVGTTEKVRGPMDYLSNFHSGIDFRDFAPVSQQLVASYAKIAQLGLPANTVAAAMLGATLNFYKAFGMSKELPDMLRTMADMIEMQGKPS